MTTAAGLHVRKVVVVLEIRTAPVPDDATAVAEVMAPIDQLVTEARVVSVTVTRD